ncbi:MAG: 5'/3'-nucleotidase SurE [Clostridiales bacterium]|nr:5'/3'-nucleotidase SurE [Clostridiales bacterium]
MVILAKKNKLLYNKKMNILICNDDGIKSKSLHYLAKELSKKHNVLVIAPSKNRSGSAHSLTVCSKLKLKRYKKEKLNMYSLSGTPADCVKFANRVFTDFNIDLVISGINKGHNLGTDILYSGTLSAAIEGSVFGYKCFAFSCVSFLEDNLDFWVNKCQEIIEKLMPISKNGTIWNVNFPNVKVEEVKGIKFVPLGNHLYNDHYVKFGKNKFSLVGEPLEVIDNPPNCDVECSRKGYITITPILFDKTDYDKLKECESL